MITVNDAYYLDKFVSTDYERLRETINDEEIAKNTLTIPYPYSLEDARWWLQRCELQYSSDEPQRSWAIRNSDGQVCGTISHHFKYGFNSHKDEIGYWLMRPLWGQGLMTEVIAKFIEHCFQDEKVKRFVYFLIMMRISVFCCFLFSFVLVQAQSQKEMTLMHSELKEYS